MTTNFEPTTNSLSTISEKSTHLPSQTTQSTNSFLTTAISSTHLISTNNWSPTTSLPTTTEGMLKMTSHPPESSCVTSVEFDMETYDMYSYDTLTVVSYLSIGCEDIENVTLSWVYSMCNKKDSTWNLQIKSGQASFDRHFFVPGCYFIYCNVYYMDGNNSNKIHANASVLVKASPLHVYISGGLLRTVAFNRGSFNIHRYALK